MSVKRIRIDFNPALHARMRELAKRKRVQIGVLYEQALREFFQKPENYMGENKPIDSKVSA